MDRAIRLLHRTGTLLGVFDARSWEQERVVLADGEGLLLYTDGITEGFNAQGAVYGVNRLKQVVLDFFDASAERICTEVLGDLEDFVGGEPQSDDLSLIVIKREKTRIPPVDSEG